MKKESKFISLKACLSAVALFVLLQGNVAWAEESPKAQARQELVAKMNNMVLSVLKDAKSSAEQRSANLQRGFTKMVDIEWIAKFVLGSAWRQANDEQKERYVELYKSYLTKVYVENYAESSERKILNIKILGINDTQGENFTARTELELTNANMRVDYLVAERDENKYKIIDVIIEGVSLLNTHRAEFTKLAAKKGVDGVIAKLEELVNSPKATVLSMNNL